MKKTPNQNLAAEITRNGSKQTYYTIQLLVDRPLIDDAYRAYAYFRWVDDYLDSESNNPIERDAFFLRQQNLLDACYRGETPDSLTQEEQMLVDMIRHDHSANSGLQSYLRNMMRVMAFDNQRRGRLISQDELNAYSQMLSIAVTDALFYFIGNKCIYPQTESRYLAVQGAHIIHMLRDMLEDAAIGYFNIPHELMEAEGFDFREVDHPAYRQWVKARIEQAEHFFKAGRDFLALINNLRCRIACCAYIARFEWLALVVKKHGYLLHEKYPERKTLKATLWMMGNILSTILGIDQREQQTL
jgi:phytoene/squalene synthetase